MPGGGRLRSIDHSLISLANERGEHAFLGRLDGSARGIYRMDADGRLSLVLKSGAATGLGTITRIMDSNDTPYAVGLGLNSQGEVAVTVRIDNGAATLLLLTPPTP
jgi:hypothetical protein